MNDYIAQRAITLAEYIIERGCTVRECAKIFKVSISTVHKDVTDRLLEISPSLAEQVAPILRKNKDERHIRGGEATKKKYSKSIRNS